MPREWKRTRIWNDSDRDWVELFNGEEVRIPAKKYVEMSRHDATRFMGQWFDPVDPTTKEIRYEKKLRKEPIIFDTGDPLSGISKTQCIICRQECGSQLMLERHMRAKHPNALPIKEEVEDDKVAANHASEEAV